LIFLTIMIFLTIKIGNISVGLLTSSVADCYACFGFDVSTLSCLLRCAGGYAKDDRDAPTEGEQA